MLPIPSFLAPASLCARVLNALLAREDWARERLERHAGKTVRFVLGKLVVGLAVDADGGVRASDPAIVPDVTLTVPAQRLAELPGALRANDTERIAALMHIQGDAALAHVVSDLARDLRWDVENDLSRLVGDIAARRLLDALKTAAGGARQGARRLAGNVGEYLSEESGVLLGRDQYREWRADILAMQQRLDALDARVARLRRKTGPGPAGGR